NRNQLIVAEQRRQKRRRHPTPTQLERYKTGSSSGCSRSDLQIPPECSDTLPAIYPPTQSRYKNHQSTLKDLPAAAAQKAQAEAYGADLVPPTVWASIAKTSAQMNLNNEETVVEGIGFMVDLAEAKTRIFRNFLLDFLDHLTSLMNNKNTKSEMGYQNQSEDKYTTAQNFK
ncbi:hypothetical protein HDV05_007534, partial [Chytridiales sp. JEL 0842]